MSETRVGTPTLPRAATTAIFFANGVGIGAWAAAIPGFKATLGLSDGWLSLALLAFAAGAIVAMPAAGLLAPRIGTGHATRAAAFVFAFALMLPSFAVGLPTLVVAALLLGAINGGLDVLMNAQASDVEHRYGRPIMSSFHAAFSAGGLFGATLGALLAAHGGILPAAALVAVLLAAGAWGTIGEGARVAEGHALALPGRAMLPLGLMALLSMICEGAMGDWSAVYLVQIGGASLSVAALGFAAFSGLMLIGRLFGDAMVARFGRPRVVRLGGATAAVGLALAVLVPWPPVAALGFGLVGLGLANVVPSVFSASGRSHGAPGIAAAATLGYAGFLLGPPLIGATATAAGLPTGFVVLALFAAAIGAAGGVIGRAER